MRGPAKVRVVVVDDSPIARGLLKSLLEADGDIEVVAQAVDGDAALLRIADLRPAIATIDLDMPGVGGLELIERIMATTPIPLIVVTGKELGSELVGQAVRRGALGVAKKPAPGKGKELRDEVRRLARVPVVRHVGPRARARAPSPDAPSRPKTPVTPAAPTPARTLARDAGSRPKTPVTPRPVPVPIVGIAASAGGPTAVASVLRALPPDLPACVAVVQHLPRGYTPHFARYLAQNTRLRVVIGKGRIGPEPGLVVVAPDDAHLVASFGGWLSDSSEAPVAGHRPSATVFFRSLARWLAHSAVGVVLSGIGSDGAEGLADLRAAGAVTIAQDQATAAVYGMPKAARDAGAAMHVTPLPEIPGLIERSLR